MNPLRIFISSVQSELSGERRVLGSYLRNDPLMRRCFEGFLFEDVPASDRLPDEVYLDEVGRCDIYVGLFGQEYGSEDQAGVSPTEREFDHATALGKHRLIFLKDAASGSRHPKMQALVRKAETGLIRKRFNTPEELVTGLYAALIEYLEDKELLRFGPFDATPCAGATLDDLDAGQMTRFVRTARRIRQFPLDEDIPTADLLQHLNLLNRGRLSNAAVLLFGKVPQRFLISSEIKCAHFHGTRVAKPIPSYQIYQGTVFDLVDQAVDFVLSKLALSVGTRAESIQVPIAYEIPKEVVTEAIVNAVVHRDYTSTGSVQVMLFADRLDIMNVGGLPPPLTVEKLRVPHESIPGNPLLAESMYLRGYIERMGTGTVDMIRRCAAAGLQEPEFAAGGDFVTTIRRPDYATQLAKVQAGGSGGEQAARTSTESGLEVTPEGISQPGPQLESELESQLESQLESELESQLESELESEPSSSLPLLQGRVLDLLVDGPMSKAELSRGMGQKQVSGPLHEAVRRLTANRMIEYMLPDKPRSRLQKYRLTEKGRAALPNLKQESPKT